MNYGFTPTESLILNYPQLLIFSPSQGSLSSSSAEPAIDLQRVFAAPSVHTWYCLLPPWAASLLNLAYLTCSNW